MTRLRRQSCLIALALLLLITVNASAQKAGQVRDQQWRDVLRNVQRELKERYYDRKFHGLAFAISATDADVIMGDGKSLEHVGVTPDELLLPTAQEMSLNHDSVMSHAASLAGVQLDPQKAGALFPIEWKRK